MEVAHRRLQRVDVLAINGRVLAPEAGKLKERIDQLFAEGRARIVLDLAQLEYISSGGLRVLVDARRRAHESRGGDVRLVNVPPRIQEVLSLTGLTSFFRIHDDLVEAVGSF